MLLPVCTRGEVFVVAMGMMVYAYVEKSEPMPLEFSRLCCMYSF